MTNTEPQWSEFDSQRMLIAVAIDCHACPQCGAKRGRVCPDAPKFPHVARINLI